MFMSSFAYLQERLEDEQDRRTISQRKFEAVWKKNGILTSLEEPPSATRTCILLPPPGKQVERVNQNIKQTHV